MTYIVVQIGLDTETGNPLYVLAKRTPGSGKVYKTDLGFRKNEPRNLEKVLADLRSLS